MGGVVNGKDASWYANISRILTQIAETKAEPQLIVRQSSLSSLQYLVPYTSRLQEI